MSTILKALRRLEEEKASAESGRPLREQIAASAPRPPERSGPGWLSAVLALVVSALAGGGLIWWLYGGEQSARDAAGEQVAAAPAAEAPAPSVREAAPPPVARPVAPASPPDDAFASDVDVVRRPERVPRLADDAPLQPNTAPKPGARRPVEDSTAMARANARAQAEIDQRAEMERLLAESQAAESPPPGPVAREAAPPPSRREPAPVAAKPEPTPKPAPVVEPKAEPAPAPSAEPKVVAAAPEPPAPAPKAAPVAEPAPAPGAASAFTSVLVEKTTWHPLSDRRSAQLRVGAEGAPREVVEGDVVDGAIVAEIQPSGVVFERDGESTRRGVGEK